MSDAYKTSEDIGRCIKYLQQIDGGKAGAEVEQLICNYIGDQLIRIRKEIAEGKREKPKGWDEFTWL